MSGKRRPVLGSEKSAAAKVAKAATRTKTFVDIMSCTARALRNGWALQVERTRRDCFAPRFASREYDLHSGSCALLYPGPLPSHFDRYVSGWEPRSTLRAVTRILDRGSGGVLAFLLPACRRPRSLLLPALSLGSLTPIAVAWQLAAVAHRYGLGADPLVAVGHAILSAYGALLCHARLLCSALPAHWPGRWLG